MTASALYRTPSRRFSSALEALHLDRKRASDPRTEARLLVLLAGLAVSAIGAGWLIAHGHTIYVAAAGIIAVLLILAFQAPGPLGALLLLAVLNGIPIVSVGHSLPGGLKVQDAAAFGLAALLAAYPDRHPSKERARIMRIATIWGACFIAWWAYEFARSFLLDGIPWLKAALFGRDFLYFAILLPLAVRARLPARSLRSAGILLLVALTLGAIGQDIQSTTGASVSWLVHPALVGADASGLGLTRLYSDIAYFADTGLIFATALLLSKESQGRRWAIGVLVALYFVGAAVQEYRANYFALVAALLVGLAFYTLRYGSLTRVLIRVGVTAALSIVVVLGVQAIAGGRNITGVHAVIVRASSGVSAVLHSTGTVGYREQVEADMLQVLGHKWPVGLGFLHPAARYVASLPEGSIRNSDTGVFNALMTMGIVGVILLYAPFLYGMRELVRASRRVSQWSRPCPSWILCGGIAWIAWAIAGSPSQLVLFSVPTLVMTALVLAGLAHVTTEPNLPIVAEESNSSALRFAVDAS